MAALALAVAATAAVAAVRLSAVRTNNWSVNSPAAVFVPLTGAGATAVGFALPAAGRKVLTYSAECAVNAPAGNNTAWLDIDIIVNGVVVPPTVGTGDAFCDANGTAGFDGWARNSITVVITGLAGANTVRVVARGNGGATGLWLGQSALVVHD
ncbi:MAG: hypothetical protein J0L57_17465 [Burkholderiales bacterium]|nr:hypothetical protein [Burkholderiales bacterium]